MLNAPSTLEHYILKLTPKEVQDARILYYFYNKNYIAELNGNIQSFEKLGLNVTIIDDPEVMLGSHDFNFILQPHLKSQSAGHELLVPAFAALRGVAVVGPPAPIRAMSEDKVLGKALAASVGVSVPSTC
jgi:D-alanine-D-alanine ligase-like ATP-grasp enzyme